MSCSARLPVYVVLLAAFFPPHQAGTAAVPAVPARHRRRGGGGLRAAAHGAARRLVDPRDGTAGLPAAATAHWSRVHTWTAVREFLRTAGTVILAATVVVWALGYFPRPGELHEKFERQRAAVPAGDAAKRRWRTARRSAESQAYLEQSTWLADIGRAVQPVFAPAGFDWRMTVGVLAAFPARELVVPTLGTLYSLGEVEASDDAADRRFAARCAARRARPRRQAVMNGLVALAAMAFFALCSQCAGDVGRDPPRDALVAVARVHVQST
jgi:ferrous iron transport protein B